MCGGHHCENGLERKHPSAGREQVGHDVRAQGRILDACRGEARPGRSEGRSWRRRSFAGVKLCNHFSPKQALFCGKSGAGQEGLFDVPYLSRLLLYTNETLNIV
jgi:hypothetical protein